MAYFPEKSAYDVSDLVELIEILRAPGGCPWDMEQTHKSLRRNLLEEAYEATEAIDRDDTEHLREELGDVLMQVIFHASIEAQQGHYDLDGVADTTVRKLIYRHPHVFGGAEVSGSEEVLVNWDKLKQTERKEETLRDTLNNVARSLPALWRAEKLTAKAVKAGVSAEGYPLELDDASDEPADAEYIIGEILLKIVSTARETGVDPELALHNACERFIAKII
jgi:tetrapyrrole methylase family protein/MazG family protein